MICEQCPWIVMTEGERESISKGINASARAGNIIICHMTCLECAGAKRYAKSERNGRPKSYATAQQEEG